MLTLFTMLTMFTILITLTTLTMLTNLKCSLALLKQSVNNPRPWITKTKNITNWMSNMASKDVSKFKKKHFCENLDRKFSLADLSLTIIELTVKAQKYS